MDIGSIVGIIIGLAGVIIGYLAEKGEISALIQPTAISIVFGGTLGATLLSFPLSELAKLPNALKTVFTIKQFNEIDIINQLADLSEKARKDGLLSLEQDAQSHDNALIRKGLSLVVDGIETEVIKDILTREISVHEGVYESGAKIFEAAGGFAPTMGVTGTVMGMVSILGHMGADTEALGHSIAVAFIATLYGVASANLFFLPMAGRIKAKAEREKMVSDIIVEGLLSIQAGENPRIIKEKLNLELLEKTYKKGSSKKSAGAEAEG